MENNIIRFIMFISVFFGIYGGMHLYAFLKIRNAWDMKKKWGLILILFMLVMIFSPFLTRISENSGYIAIAVLSAYTGYIWAALLFLFISVSFILDIYRLLIKTVNIIPVVDFSRFVPSKRRSFFISIALTSAIMIYGYFEAYNIKTENIIIKTAKLPESIKKLRIVQISDVHLGLIVGKKRLKRIAALSKKARPDILVSTGDLVDGQINDLLELIEILKSIKTKYGKFAVTGNHEFYAGLARALEFTEKSGFKNLRGEAINIPGVITIAGVDDLSERNPEQIKKVSEKNLLEQYIGKEFVLLLKHRPKIEKEALGLFDLQLSGHIHKGQIFPFTLITNMTFQYRCGLTELEKKSKLYTSRGTGTWGPPIRFLATPEITVIDLIRE